MKLFSHLKLNFLMKEHFSLRKDDCSEATARQGGQIKAKLLLKSSMFSVRTIFSRGSDWKPHRNQTGPAGTDMGGMLLSWAVPNQRRSLG